MTLTDSLEQGWQCLAISNVLEVDQLLSSARLPQVMVGPVQIQLHQNKGAGGRRGEEGQEELEKKNEVQDWRRGTHSVRIQEIIYAKSVE